MKTLAATLATCALGVAFISYLYIKVVEAGYTVVMPWEVI